MDELQKYWEDTLAMPLVASKAAEGLPRSAASLEVLDLTTNRMMRHPGMLTLQQSTAIAGQHMPASLYASMGGPAEARY
jgi:hypothetical protein